MNTEFKEGNSVTDEVLGAYIDGELDETMRIEVEAYLAANPRAVEYVQQASKLRDNLHRLFDNQLAVPLPPHHAELAEELERHTSCRKRSPIRPQLLAACIAALVLVAGAGLGWRYLSSDITGQRMFALFDQQVPAEGKAQKQQVSGGQQVLNDSGGQQVATKQAVAASQGDDLEGGQPSATGEQAPAPAVSAPDFSSFGFNLVGTRVLAKHDDRSMQLIYESSEGARVELFYTSGSSISKSSLTLMEEGPIAVLFWHNAGRSYSLIGEVDRNTLLEIGKVVNGEWTVPVPAAEQSSGGDKKQTKTDGSTAPVAPVNEPAAKSQNDLGVAPVENETITPEELAPAEVETEKQT
jgi:anti-sigma factor RsiW